MKSMRAVVTGVLLFGLAIAAYGNLPVVNHLTSEISTGSLDTPIPVDPQVRHGKLGNGLSYYIRKNGRPARHVELRLVVKAGSVLEDEDQLGLAHFTEHLAFAGTRHFRKNELISYLQSIGVKFGADLNAYTSFDETVYILPIPTDKPENLETGMLILEDWAQGITMEADAIDRERNIILEEARMGKGADERMRRKLLPAVLNGSHYAERIPIGKEEVIKSFPYEVIRRFYRDWYRPDLMAVVVVGDIDPVRGEEMVRAHFGQLKNPEHERPRNGAAIPPVSSSKGLVITDREATSNMVSIRYPAFKAAPEVTLGDYRGSLIRHLFDGMMGERLRELAEQAEPPYLGAYSGEEPLVADYKNYTSSMYIGRKGAKAAIAAVVAENERARKYGFTQTEIDEGKKRMLRDYESAWKERDKSESSSYVREYVGNFLVREPIPGIEKEFEYAGMLLPTISMDDINTYARNVIPQGGSKLVVFTGASHDKKMIPTELELLRQVEQAEKAAVKPPAERKVVAGLMRQIPTSGAIVREEVDKDLGTTSLTLTNGIKVVLKPTAFKNDQVLLAATRYGGTMLFDDKDRNNARFATSIVAAMGLGVFTPVELDRVMAGKNAWVNVGGDGYTESISGGASTVDMESMFQLLYLRMQPPRRDEALFRAYISKSQDMSRDLLSSPEVVFSNTVLATLYKKHPRIAYAPRPEDYAGIKLERVLSIYRERFGSVRGFTFHIVGSFEVEKIKPLISTYLASLPSGEIAPGFRDRHIRPAKGVFRKELKMGLEQKSRVSIIFTGDTDYSEAGRLRLLMLSEIMNNRIIETLRQKLSLIYSGGMRASLDRTPMNGYRLSITLPCAPENVESVIKAMFAEIEDIRSNGPQQVELDKVRQAWIENHNIAMRTNGKWLSYLRDASLYGDDPRGILAEQEMVEKITPVEVKEAARRYFDEKNYLQATLSPEKVIKGLGEQSSGGTSQ